MNLRTRIIAEEQMDAPNLDRHTYAAMLADLARVNRLTLAARPTLAFLKQATQGKTAFRLLDVGFGQGDMLRSIFAWAGKCGIAARLVGIDLNPSSAPAARAATLPDMPIDYRTGDLFALAGEGFDLIVSSLVAHHMADDELIVFLRFMEREAAAGWMVNDLRRSALAYAGFPWLARLMRWHPIVREDGRLSIARSFRAEDWRALLARSGIPEGAARIVRRFPFRLCVERLR